MDQYGSARTIDSTRHLDEIADDARAIRVT